MTDRLQLALFDCDGTIVDSAAAILDAVHRAFDEANEPRPPEARIRPLIGLPSLRMFELLLPDARSSRHHELQATFRHHRFSTEHTEERVFFGMDRLLAGLDGAGWLLGMATSNSRQSLDLTLDRFRLRRHFVTLQTGDRHPSKPHPAMVEAAMAAVGAEACATTLVGDTTFDIEMAVNAGVTPIGVAWGHHSPADLHAAGAKVVVGNVAELELALRP
jgi:phosphoglycolate phosphatase